MNRRLFGNVAIISLLLLAFALSGCKEKKKDYYNPMVQELDDTRDDAITATLEKIEGDSIFIRVKYSQDREALGISEALSDDNIKGSLKVGNEYSIYANWKHRYVEIAINVTELKGRWYYDMEQHRGFDFGAYGALSSVNNDKYSFREWKLLNGKLYIYYVEMDQENTDRHEYFVEEAEIKHLDKDNLELDYLGETWVCKRETKVLKFKDVVKE